MSDLLLDPQTNDLILVNGDLQLADGDDAIAQDVQGALELFIGEWFLDTSQGVPYYQSILTKGVDLDLVQVILIEQVRSRSGVVDVLSLDFDFDPKTRALSVTTQIRSTSGELLDIDAEAGGV